MNLLPIDPLLATYFPRASNYRNDHAQYQFNEAGVPFFHFPYQERHLQCIWSDPRLRPTDLMTTDGERVTIEQPGEWNLEAGPDFRRAVLLIGKEQRRIEGDLEIHIHPKGWYQHGHAGDPSFSNTRFHLVYFPGEEIPGLIQIPLKQALDANSQFSFENIDTTAYPYTLPFGDFPLKSMPPDQKTEWLESAGEERLRRKALHYSHALQETEPQQLLWEELLAALGYKNNKTPFRTLATLLPLVRLHTLATSPLQAYALLLGLSGLMPADLSATWDSETRLFIRSLWDFWWKQSEELKDLALPAETWNLANLRPMNHPTRRLMAAAHYAFSISDIAKDHHKLSEVPDNFWTTHLSWSKRCSPTALVGSSRANAIMINVITPWNAATHTAPIQLSKLPAEPSNSIIRQTAYTLFGPDVPTKLYRSALARQGLIQIFHDYIITHKIEALKTATMQI